MALTEVGWCFTMVALLEFVVRPKQDEWRWGFGDDAEGGSEHDLRDEFWWSEWGFIFSEEIVAFESLVF